MVEAMKTSKTVANTKIGFIAQDVLVYCQEYHIDLDEVLTRIKNRVIEKRGKRKGQCHLEGIE